MTLLTKNCKKSFKKSTQTANMTDLVPSRRILLASNNSGKLREFSAMLAPLGIDLIAQGELNIPPAEEPHPTFLENALAKARHATALSGHPALADDSGLCVETLDGNPGVRSARYAGPEASDAANNAMLLATLATLPPDRPHRAFYTCVLVYLSHSADPCPLIAEGRWYGEITLTPRGHNGFGYDPLFYLPELGKTAAELDIADKNARSHRALALAHLVEQLRQRRSDG